MSTNRREIIVPGLRAIAAMSNPRATMLISSQVTHMFKNEKKPGEGKLLIILPIQKLKLQQESFRSD